MMFSQVVQPGGSAGRPTGGTLAIAGSNTNGYRPGPGAGTGGLCKGKSDTVGSMWAARLFTIAYGMPSIKRLLWRSWYNFLSDRYRDRRWTFMNYGYSPRPAALPLALAAEDESDRNCIQLYQLVASAVDLAGSDVLEIGCGRGGGTSYVARYLHPGQMIGVDFSWRAVAFCRKHHTTAGLSFVKGNAERVSFPDASFDVVLNIESSHCYGNPIAFYSEVQRVLRPGGHFLYADFRSREELAPWRAQLLASGLRLISEHDITPGVVAALDDDDGRKRQLIDQVVDRPLRRIFRQFAALRGTPLYDEFRTGAVSYRMFVFQHVPGPAEGQQDVPMGDVQSPGD